MTTTSTWSQANSAYLSAAMDWLRLRLQQCAQESSVERTPAAKKTGAGGQATQEKTKSLKMRLTEAEAEMARLAAEMKAPPALLLLSEALGLSNYEREILLLSSAPEFDSSIPALCAEAAGSTGRELPTFSLAMKAFKDPAWDALSTDRPLRYWRLIEIDQAGSHSITTSPLRADERIINYIKGLNRVDDRLALYFAPTSQQDLERTLPPSQQVVAEAIAQCWQYSPLDSGFPLIQMPGPDHASKQMIAAHAAEMDGRVLYRVSADSLPTHAAELELLARLWQRESALLPLALYVDAQTSESPSSETQASATRRFLSRTSGRLLLGVREGWSGLPREHVSFDAGKPTREEQRALWTETLGAKQAGTAALLASQFNLSLFQIRQIAETTDSNKKTSPEVFCNKLWSNCLLRVRPLLDTLAHRIDAKFTWDDIVLPEQEHKMLRQISAQVRDRSRVYDDWGFAKKMNRGMGINALFAGESGTGKTTAAEVIANDLQLNLYRIDLSAVVSKYIGETEKNLSRLFDAAEDGGAILLFDEADALFGKRGEVKDSIDRYANIEVNYLLQRMESYTGLAILATNMRSALDVAFTRRLRFIVNFPFPNIADRKRMWIKAFPQQTPKHGLDFDRLAKFNLTGGAISNAAVNAAFLAAHAGSPVTMQLALAAARQEMVKLDRPINEAEFEFSEIEELGQTA